MKIDGNNIINKYEINISYSDEDKGFIARVVNVNEFEFNSAFGHTREEALRELEWAIKSMIEIRIEKNLPIPKSKKKLRIN